MITRSALRVDMEETEVLSQKECNPGSVSCGSPDVEVVRSEEVQDITDRMPTRWTECGTLLTALLILGIVALGFIIKYPDTVDGQISVTIHATPVRLVANTNGDHLRKGDVIG